MEIDEGDVTPEVLLPVQHADRQFRGARMQPEKRLQLAILADAVSTHAQLATVVTSKARSLFAEVDEWFASDVPAGPFSFVAICDSLGLEPAYIRRGLLRLHTHNGTPSKRKLSLRHEGGSRHHIVRPRVQQVA